MKKQELEKDYCTLGKENECPHIEYCYRTNSFSLELLQIDFQKKEYFKVTGEKEIAQKKITKDIEEKVKKSIKWKSKKMEEITFACTELRKEPRSRRIIFEPKY